MSVTSAELLRFILSLLGNPTQAEAFSEDPSGVMSAAGLGSVSCADVDAITPLIANSAPGAVAITHSASAAPAEMIQHIVKNIAVSNYDNSGVVQNIWTTGDVRQAFASDGGLAIGGDLHTDDPLVLGDGNTIASDDAHAAGRDIIQNQGDGNLALGGDQSIAQDNGVIAGGDNLTAGDKVGGNNNEADNTGNDNSVSVGGNQNNAENTGNSTVQDNSTTIGGNNNAAENTGNSTVHDQSVTVGDVSVDLSQDNSVSVGGNQNNAENTGNSVAVGDIDLSQDNSVTVGDIDLSQDNSVTVGDIDLSQNEHVGGDYWENGSNVGGIGNTDNRNSNNTADSGNTVVITENNDDSITVGTIAVDLSQDNSSTTGDTTITDDNSTSVGDITITDDHSYTTGDATTVEDNSYTTGDTTTIDDNSYTVGDTTITDDNSTSVGDTTITDDHSYTTGDTTTVDDNSYTGGTTSDFTYTYEDNSVGGNVYEQGGGSSYGDYTESGSGNSTVDSSTSTVVNDYDYTYGA